MAKAKTNKNVSSSQKLYGKYLSKMEGFLSNKEAKEIYDELAGGKNSYMKMNRLQTSAFDTSWIDKIEDVIFDLGDIIANPRMNTKSVAEIIPVELARKVNAESVRHLASHTQFIKDIDENGDVIPNKILNISYEDDLNTYENKFIATFVRKLVLFVEKRYEYVESISSIYNEDVLFFKNDSIVKGNEVSIETKIKIRTETEDNSREKLKSYLDRILQIREYILYFYNSPFMRKLKTERNVRNPILQTNIIRKNLKYHHCYEVYKFIESYTSLGVESKVNESYQKLSDAELREINNVVLVNYLSAKCGKDAPNAKVQSRYYKPKILSELEDESFLYGPLYEGPVSFVRTDEQFRNWFSNKISKYLPDHPNKHEREYYKDEYSIKKDIKEDITATDYLIKRDQRNTERFNKIVEQIIKEREEEARRIEEEIAEAKRAEEEAELNRVREALQERAQKDFPTRTNEEVDKIIDEILNEGYDPNDVEFMETFDETVKEQFQEEVINDDAFLEEIEKEKAEEEAQKKFDEAVRIAVEAKLAEIKAAEEAAKAEEEARLAQEAEQPNELSENADSVANENTPEEQQATSEENVANVEETVSNEESSNSEQVEAGAEEANNVEAVASESNEETSENTETSENIESLEGSEAAGEAEPNQTVEAETIEDPSNQEAVAIPTEEVDPAKTEEERRLAEEKAKQEFDDAVNAEVERKLKEILSSKEAYKEYVKQNEISAMSDEEFFANPANKDEWDEFKNPNAPKEDENMEDVPVEQLPNKPINLVKEEEKLLESGTDDALANKDSGDSITNNVEMPEEPEDLYDEDDGSGVWYVVRQFQGFYISDRETTRKKDEAKIFKAESAVRRFKLTHYGRVKRYIPTPVVEVKKKNRKK